jgi:NADP-dependent 3-hydroxy acid dehydrogenase YdfG
MQLADRVLIVTGAGGAIAGPIVERFAAAGARLVLADMKREHVEERARQVGGLPLAVDLGRADGAVEMVRAAIDRFGRLDGLIHTVGGFAMGPLAAADAAAYDRMFDLNVRTLFHAVRAVLPSLVERGDGFVAGFSAGPGLRGEGAGMALYAAAKSAVATLLRSLDGELAGTAIRVAVVYPMGSVDTPANRKASPDADPAGWIDPAEIADTLLHAATRGPRGRLVELAIHPPRPR